MEAPLALCVLPISTSSSFFSHEDGFHKLAHWHAGTLVLLERGYLSMENFLKMVAESGCTIQDRRSGDQLPRAARLAHSQYTAVAYDIFLSEEWCQIPSDLSTKQINYARERLGRGYDKALKCLAKKGVEISVAEATRKLNFCWKPLFSILEADKS